MATQIFANFASALLAASIDDNDLTIQVASGFGALFPSPGAGEFFLVALENASGDREIVKIESRSSDLLTVAASGRGQEGTSAQSWTNGLTRVEVRATKGTLDRFIQREGDSMDGDLDMGGNEIADARLTGDTVVVGGQLVGTAVRGTEDISTNEIVVPSDGTRATAGGARILVESDSSDIREASFEVGMVTLWYGAAVNCPDGWAICDGSTVNGHATPDMREKIAIGVGGSLGVGDTAGSATPPGGVTGSTVLTEAQLPAHSHAPLMALTASGGADGGILGTEQSSGQTYNSSPQPTGNVPLSQSVGSGEGHTHTLSFSMLPPVRALHYIMFVGF